MRPTQNLLGLKRRLQGLQLVVGFIFAVVVASYYRVQVLNHDHYVDLGEKYRIKKRPVMATRGLVYDREKRLITRNLPSYNLVLQRDEMDQPFQQALPNLAQFLEKPPEQLQHAYEEYRGSLLSQPIPLEENVSFETVLKALRNRLNFPGLAVEVSSRRDYVYPDLFSHVLGYVGEASSQDLQNNPDLMLGDVVGKRGIENSYNSVLTGIQGEKAIHINSRGVIFREEMENPPIPGGNLTLTLDLDLQMAAKQAIGEHGGVILLMDVRNGDLLVFYSSPTFDLNQFSKQMSREQWADLINQPGQPLFNRPLQGLYAPGSIFKLVTVLSALHNNLIHSNTKVYCSGSYQYLGRTFHCHKRDGHGELDLWEAIQKSCNVYMYTISKDLGAQALAETAYDLGFGQKSGIDVVGEKLGIVPSPKWKQQTTGKPWYSGETLNMAIGQGNVQVTPIQLVKMMAIIASEGHCPQPHILKGLEHQGEEQPFEPTISRCSTIETEHFTTVKTAMWQVVNRPSGTGSAAAIPGFDVCGKTGTAQLLTFRSEADRKLERNMNAWFAGFAPLDNPQVAILVLVEQVGAGSTKAAPIAREVLSAYFLKYGRLPAL
ncbi:MAG: penicillin-binding protein 2 [Acidobacteria bacterium]|nr:penicillin-binding protein 2 [Acidobacteriota bacterium]